MVIHESQLFTKFLQCLHVYIESSTEQLAMYLLGSSIMYRSQTPFQPTNVVKSVCQACVAITGPHFQRLATMALGAGNTNLGTSRIQTASSQMIREGTAINQGPNASTSRAIFQDFGFDVVLLVMSDALWKCDRAVPAQCQ